MRLRVKMTFRVRLLQYQRVRDKQTGPSTCGAGLCRGEICSILLFPKKKQKKKQASGVLQLQGQVSIDERNCKCVGSASCLFPAMAVAVNAVAKWPPVNTPVNRRGEHVTRKWSVR